jgi:hypothetical protein
VPTITVVELHRKSSDDPGVEFALSVRRVMNGYVKCTGCLSLLSLSHFLLQYIIIFYLSYLVGVILANYSAVANFMTVKHFFFYP